MEAPVALLIRVVPLTYPANNMSLLLAAFFVLFGLIGIFSPRFLYKAELLSPQQIARNNRLFKRGGVVLLLVGIFLLIMAFPK